MEPPPRRARPLAATAFVLGLVLAAASLAILLSMAADARDVRLDAWEAEHNGTTTRAYAPLVGASAPGVVDLRWALPGETRVARLACDDLEAFAQGRPTKETVSTIHEAREGHLRLDLDEFLFASRPLPPIAPGHPTIPPMPRLSFCGPDLVAFQWPTDATGSAQVEVVREERPLDEPVVPILVGSTATGAVLSVLGGIGWTRRPPRASPPEDEGTAEALLRLTDRSVDWLGRMKRYLLVGGLVGLFPWYPVLLTWAWRAGRRASADGAMAIVLALLVLLVLGGLTFLWAREYVRLGDELTKWRERMERLRKREADLLDKLAEP